MLAQKEQGALSYQVLLPKLVTVEIIGLDLVLIRRAKQYIPDFWIRTKQDRILRRYLVLLKY
jgi:hypothetical protein